MAFSAPGAAAATTEAATGATGDVIVVLSLRGGMDGLSMIVPTFDPAYYAARPNTSLPAGATSPLARLRPAPQRR